MVSQPSSNDPITLSLHIFTEVHCNPIFKTNKVFRHMSAFENIALTKQVLQFYSTAMPNSSDDSDSFQTQAQSDSVDCHLHEPISKSVHPSQSPPPRVSKPVHGDLRTIDLMGVTSESENESCSGSQAISASSQELEEAQPQDHSASSSESNPDLVISKYSV